VDIFEPILSADIAKSAHTK